MKSDGQLCPRLVKLVENPLLSETLDYIVREGRQVVGHWAPDATADIMLRGSLIAESHWSAMLEVLFMITYTVICEKHPLVCVFLIVAAWLVFSRFIIFVPCQISVACIHSISLNVSIHCLTKMEKQHF